MKILILSTLSLFLLGSCAHHHKDLGGHHHHKCKMKNCSMEKMKGKAFNKHCAMSVSMGDMHVEGQEDYKFVHGGETYYFSSEKKMKTFKANLETNLQQAQEHWRGADIR